MQTAIIILSISLAIAVLYGIVVSRLLYIAVGEILQVEEREEEIAFENGLIDIPEEVIEEKFPNAILFCHLERDDIHQNWWKAFDVSSYAKNRVIGLTYFVQPHIFDDLAQSIRDGEVRDAIRQQLKEMMDDEVESEIIDNIIDETLDEMGYRIDDSGTTMTKPLIPNCTVYHLKDGRWLWRQE